MRKRFKPRFRKTPPPTGLWNRIKKVYRPVLLAQLLPKTPKFMDYVQPTGGAS